MSDAKTVSLKIMAMAEKAGMKLKDVADKLGIPREEWALWIKGTKIPEPDVLEKICEVIGCEVKDITGGKTRKSGAGKDNTEKGTKEHKTRKKAVEESSAPNGEETVKRDTGNDIPVNKVEEIKDMPTEESAKEPERMPETEPIKKARTRTPRQSKKKAESGVFTAEVEDAIRRELSLKKSDKVSTAIIDDMVERIFKKAADEYSVLVNGIAHVTEIAKIFGTALENGNIPERYKELFSAAEDASDEGINLAITILRKFKK